MIDIAIVIVNYKMKNDIDRCLASVYADMAQCRLNVQVVVVDSASADSIDTFLKAKYPKVKCVMLPDNKGFSHAQNVGIKSVEAAYYLVLNPDTYFTAGHNTLTRLHEYMAKHRAVGLIGPKTVYPDGTLQYSCYRFPTFWQPLFSRTSMGERGRGKRFNDRFLMKDFDHDSSQPVDWVMGSAMFIRGEALRAVGLFDERFWMYSEDSDLCRRMWEAHWPVYYISDIIITHVHGRGSAKVPGIIRPLLKNKLARTHLLSWLKYMWKWKGNLRFYAHKLP